MLLRLLQIRRGLSQFAGLHVGLAQIVVGVEVVGLKLRRLA